MKKVGRTTTKVLFLVFTFCLGTISAQDSSTENKSAITITYPISSTVWETAALAELRWTTKNMDTTKIHSLFFGA
ncbi:hypothetical protein GTQ34_11990 [Muricauda sp. JGD-17]|uniref:Uncharacterized protein n=1 Tax=Flagellimonas ochracea TaxID=2696472 RepID=A0A964TEC6_9FLAO|nr:hypothetical protein [Allomuricauda ochracea]NAY92639.1 hypothetical protein [Allomuricauda ochracea]